MRKITLFMNVSLDGYFEGPGHDITGFVNDPEIFASRGQAAVDTMLFGHRTYEGMKFWTTPQAMQSMPEISRAMNETPKLVASHAPFEPGWNKVTVISGNVIEQVRQLKQQPGKGIIIFGSNQLVVDLMQAGLMDEFQIVVNPVIFGEGTPLFKGLQKKASLKLTNSQTFKSGCVLLTYQPA